MPTLDVVTVIGDTRGGGGGVKRREPAGYRKHRRTSRSPLPPPPPRSPTSGSLFMKVSTGTAPTTDGFDDI